MATMKELQNFRQFFWLVVVPFVHIKVLYDILKSLVNEYSNASAWPTAPSTKIILERTIYGDAAEVAPSFVTPAIVVSGKFNFSCSRQHFCNASTECRPTHLSPSDLLLEKYDQNYPAILAKFLFGPSRGKQGFLIQFWGDSIMAQMECDMRQWQFQYTHDFRRQQQQLSFINPPSLSKQPFGIKSEMIDQYVQVGFPWAGFKGKRDIKMQELELISEKADVIVFNIGAHYEPHNASLFETDVQEYYHRILKPFVDQGGFVVVRSPSATHFPTKDGLRQPEIASMNNITCVPRQMLPTVIVQQDKVLQKLVDELGGDRAYYLNVYHIGDHFNHRPEARDCKHYCSNCGVYRAWNTMLASILMTKIPKVIRKQI